NRVLKKMGSFFFLAEDGIRDYKVTGVQTCALPIFVKHLALLLVLVGNRSAEPLEPMSARACMKEARMRTAIALATAAFAVVGLEIGRASCRERVWVLGVVVIF